MPNSVLDPLSQLIGGLSAQVQGLASQITDLRAEVVTNRSSNQIRWDDLTKQMDLVQAEYRNVKHMERGLEQEKLLIAQRLQGMDSRLDAIERMILIWRTRYSMLLAGGVALGTFLGGILHAIFGVWLGAIWH
jgi:hypothetical protein